MKMTETARIDTILANQAQILKNLDACLGPGSHGPEPVSNSSWDSNLDTQWTHLETSTAQQPTVWQKRQSQTNCNRESSCVKAMKDADVNNVRGFAHACTDAGGTLLLSTRNEEHGRLGAFDAITRYQSAILDGPHLRCSKPIAGSCDWKQSIEDCM